MEIWKDYYKVIDVINSCQTIEQLKCASRMLGFWLNNHSDTQVYQNTFINVIKKKFNELNGEDITEIPFIMINIV